MQDPRGHIRHASEFLVFLDTPIPLDPANVFSKAHQIGETSSDTWVTVRWSPALNPTPGSGIAGYSIEWSRFPNSVPDPIQDLNALVVEATTGELQLGTWYMQLRTRIALETRQLRFI